MNQAQLNLQAGFMQFLTLTPLPQHWKLAAIYYTQLKTAQVPGVYVRSVPHFIQKCHNFVHSS